MITFIFKRVLYFFPLGAGVVTLVSLMILVIPGDPVDAILGPYSTLEDQAELREQLGLSKPAHEQVADYFKQVVSGELGTSLIYNRPVGELISSRLWPTCELAIYSIMVALFISIPLGIFSALRAGTLADGTAMFVSLVGVAMPNFWLGPMLVLLFSVSLGWLPVSERGGILSYVLPCITLGTALAAVLSRMTRNSMLENLNEDYVRTARAKGVARVHVIYKHTLRNAAMPLVTVVGLQFGALVTGAIITERIFDWPGIGSLILEGIQTRDYPVVQGCVLVFSFSYLIVNLVTDIAYTIVDPRVR